MLAEKKQGFIKGALIISLGGFISKLLGALYRIPLIAYLGGRGMGIYQMVYPLYCMLLTLSASGIPTGIARLISSGKSEGAERKAFFIYGVLGLIGSAAMFAFSSPLAAAQGESAVANCCRLLSPSVFFVSIISVVRGYFQGKGNMYPTALSEVFEQAIKVAAGIALAGAFRGDVARATGAAVFAVTLSECAVAIFALFLYLGAPKQKKPLYKLKSVKAKDILFYTVPLTFTAIALPVSQLVESIAVVNVMRGFTADATALYGVYSGCAVTIINLPVSVTYGLAAASVPRISPLAEKGDTAGAKREVYRALLYTFIISLPCAVALFFGAPVAVKLIFPSLGGGEKSLLINLIKIMSVNAVTSSLVQTSSACLTSLGKPLYGTLTQWITAFMRVGLSAVLVAFTPLSVAGLAISANCCYFVAVVFNFCYIIKVKCKPGKKNENNTDRLGNGRRRFDAFGGARS